MTEEAEVAVEVEPSSQAFYLKKIGLEDHRIISISLIDQKMNSRELVEGISPSQKKWS